MSNIQDQPAFPTVEEQDRNMITTPGMTLRQYYAGQAMSGFIASYAGESSNPTPKVLAAKCLEYADALIYELEKPQQ